jgi:hypothetical protein
LGPKQLGVALRTGEWSHFNMRPEDPDEFNSTESNNAESKVSVALTFFQRLLHPEKLEQMRRDFITYLMNPVEFIKHVPNWDWMMLISFYVVFAATCGVAGGIVSTHFKLIFVGLIFTPIISLFTAAVVTGALYFTLIFFFHREPPLHQVFTIIMFSAFPTMVLMIVSHWVPPIIVVGLLVSGLLLIVGVTENVQIDRKKFAKLVGAVYVVYLAFWTYSTIHFQSEKEKYKNSITTPETRDVLKQEFEKTKEDQ